LIAKKIFAKRKEATEKESILRAESRRPRLILARISVEPVSERLAMISGEALAAVPGATAIDAIVMASAAQRGDAVFTSDVEDLDRLRRHFPDVRVFRA